MMNGEWRGAEASQEDLRLCVDVTDERLARVREAVGVWCSKLRDHSANNRLIYYRHLKSGTLSFEEADPNNRERLLGGSEVRLSHLFPVQNENDQKLDGPELDEAIGVREMEERRQKDALRRTKTLYATGVTNLEERGIRTLYVASHTATWDPGDVTSATPNAPVLLRPLEISSLGGGRRDFTLSLPGEWEVNQTLLHFWSKTFGVDLVATGLSDVLREWTPSDEDSPKRIVNKVIGLVAASGQVPNLRVDGGEFGGNFAYTKLPMVNDLESNLDLLAAHPLIAAIAGDSDAANEVRVVNSLDDISLSQPDHVAPADEYLILDSDSSQSHIINTAVAGGSMIVQGPPGTGKSQTIANLIASLAARGQSILFVAEKRAAIEAVLKRLENPGLTGEEPGLDLSCLALDLHRSTVRKKDAAVALGASLARFGSTARPSVAFDQAQLSVARSRMVDYAAELHRVREPFGLTSYQVHRDIIDAGSELPFIALDPSIVERYSPDWVARVTNDLERWVAIRRNVDWTCGWVSAPRSTVSEAKSLTKTVRLLHKKLLPEVEDLLEDLSGITGLDPMRATPGQVCDQSKLIDQVALIEEQVAQEIWDLDLDAMSRLFEERGWMSLFNSELRAARKAIRELTVAKLKTAEQQDLVARAATARRAWESLGTRLPLPMVDPSAREALRFAVGRLVAALRDSHLPFTADPLEMPFPDLMNEAQELIACEEIAQLLVQLHQQRSKVSDAGCEAIIDLVKAGELKEDLVGEVLIVNLLRGIKSVIDTGNHVLNPFDSEDQAQAVDSFSKLDRKHLMSGPARVLRAVAERSLTARNSHPEQSALVKREAQKSRRHRTLRQLHKEAGDVLIALKPCWMMSPLMVAQTLPAQAIFDYVIFDEASQIRPEEAISAIVRGRNLIVAGDPRQLPPSAFFAGAMDADGPDEYDEDDIDALTDGYESILDVTNALLPSRMLSWHYRSRDERLIKLSNDHIYGRSLRTFPGAVKDSPISFCRVEHTPLDKSEIRSNPTEVAAVVELMFDHARQRPSESLGVIAFGLHHADAIEGELHRQLMEAEGEEDAVLEFFDENAVERTFVKNIERVQGDERDAIILSVGYGKDLAGRVPLRFGPVNQDGGERRINVAASRSRQRMTVVSSIAHGDFDPSGMKAGPKLLQSLLKFAASGGVDTGEAGRAEPLNPFELAVMLELQKLGLNPISQYGSSGFRIDFALPDPDVPGRMVLAVEADGATYHSSPTARDRDRLRQEVLERLGWRFHRIWSTAFFRNPQEEAMRVKVAFEAALRAEQTHPDIEPRRDAPLSSRSVTKGVQRPRLRQGLQIAQYDHRQLVALARWITEDGEILLTNNEVKERMKNELGFARRGSRIEAAFNRALSALR